MDVGFWYVVLVALIEIYGDFALRFYAQTQQTSWLVHGVIGYAGVVYFLIQSFRFKNVLYVNVMWDGLSGLLESMAAFAILGDRLQTLSQYVGVAFIILGVVLLKA